MRFRLSDEKYYKFTRGRIVETTSGKKRYILQLINAIEELEPNRVFSPYYYHYVSTKLLEEEENILETCGELIVIYHKPNRLFIKYVGEKISKRKAKVEKVIICQ